MIGLYQVGEDISMDLLSVYDFFSPWELFNGPPWLEREKRIRESLVQVPTGTTSGPQE
jgi:hypothetical protein